VTRTQCRASHPCERSDEPGGPEENVDRVAEAVGLDPIVFGSDFPHGEGLPEPQMYLGQLKNLSDDQKKAVVRGNLARFLDLAV
jgi:predicted TIM-barrel fold metal-dependent hydrolase